MMRPLHNAGRFFAYAQNDMQKPFYCHPAMKQTKSSHLNSIC